MNHYIKIKEKKIDIQSGTHGRKLLITQKIRKEKILTKKPPNQVVQGDTKNPIPFSHGSRANPVTFTIIKVIYIDRIYANVGLNSHLHTLH